MSKPAPKPVPKPEPAPPAPKPEPKPEGLKTICFHEGEIIDCSLWGGDGHGKDWGGDGHSGSGDWADDGHGDDDKWADDGHDADDDEWANDGHSGGKGEDDDEWNGDGHDGGEFSVAFTYTVNTDGKSDPEDLITPALENAILADVAAYIEDSDDYSDFSGKISAKPEDYIAGEYKQRRPTVAFISFPSILTDLFDFHLPFSKTMNTVVTANPSGVLSSRAK